MRIKRIFIVGCPRSGTTLLQSLLMHIEGVTSIPESHFFSLIESKYYLLQKLRLTTPNTLRHLNQWLEPMDIHINDSLRYADIINQFVQQMDLKAREQNCDSWIEKTPGHLCVIPFIKRYIPDAIFIHLIRRGEDNIQSLHQATKNYPENWGTKWTLETCAQRWIQDINLSKQYIQDPSSIFVSYDHLVDQPQMNMNKISDLLNKPRITGELTPNKYASKVTTLTEKTKWKKNNFSSIIEKKQNTGSEHQIPTQLTKKINQVTLDFPFVL